MPVVLPYLRTLWLACDIPLEDLRRALSVRPARALAGPTRVVSPGPVETPAFDVPAPAWVQDSAEPAFHPVLDPFSVYAKGEDLLRQKLSAMSPWHLRNIIRGYDLASHPSIDLETLTAEKLIGIIMLGVRARV